MTDRSTAGGMGQRVAELEAALRDARQKLSASLRRFEAVAHHSFDIITIVDRDGVFRYCNGAATRCLGYDFMSVGVPALDLVHPDDQPVVRRALVQLLAAGSAQTSFECRLATATGGWRDLVNVGVNLVDDPAIGGILFHSLDVTAQREAERQVEHASTHDALTGVATFQLFVRDLDRARARARRSTKTFAVLVVDIDDFRSVNVEHGPGVGDRVLVDVAGRIAGVLRSYDTVGRTTTAFARLSGDEFLVLCEEVDDAATQVIAGRIRDAVGRAPFHVAGHDLTVTVSVGAVVGMSDSTAEQLLVDAESAMDRAKQHGGASAAFGSTRSEPATSPFFVRDLRRAIAEGELVVEYQPKVELATSRVVGLEALVRWHHPDRGVVPPAAFIPVAEDSGLIRDLGSWVLREACRQRAAWERVRSGETPLIVCVNVSAAQFDPSLPALVDDVLRGAALPGSALCLELTESALMRDVEASVATVHELAALGVGVSVDDFGTGYSSLAYLKRFPLTELKIDRSFIAGLGTDVEDTAITAAVIAMAQALDLEVVAEGVETEAQVANLRGLGCEIGQGFLFSRAVPAVDIEPAVATGRLPTSPASDMAGRVGDLVLVVDDAPDVRHLARVSLTTAGFEVVEATDGSEALRIAAERPPAAVLADISMPGMSGLELCRALRSQAATAGLTILMLTSSDEAAAKVEAFTSGADDYITKPFSPRDLVGRVRQAVERRRDGGRPR